MNDSHLRTDVPHFYFYPDATLDERRRTDRMIGRARILLEIVVPFSTLPEREGGQLAISEIITGQNGHQELMYHVITPLGAIRPRSRISTYFSIAKEKSRRLFRNLPLHHRTSYESRSPGNGRYGEAVVAGRWIVAFSGLDEHDDESLILNLLIWEGLLSPTEAFEIAERSRNQQFIKVYEFCMKQRLFLRP